MKQVFTNEFLQEFKPYELLEYKNKDQAPKVSKYKRQDQKERGISKKHSTAVPKAGKRGKLSKSKKTVRHSNWKLYKGKKKVSLHLLRKNLHKGIKKHNNKPLLVKTRLSGSKARRGQSRHSSLLPMSQLLSGTHQKRGRMVSRIQTQTIRKRKVRVTPYEGIEYYEIPKKRSKNTYRLLRKEAK
jgi:hypothetical protein